MPPSHLNGFHSEIAKLILGNYAKLTSQTLIRTGELNLGQLLYEAPFAVLAHDNSPEPIFFYGNLRAQQVFEMTWDELTILPSRLSAEPVNQAERVRLLEQVSNNGYIDNYSGVRISKTGKRFLIEHATVWNLTSNGGTQVGQAATFKDITTLIP